MRQLSAIMLELGMNPKLSCLPEKVPFLRCIAAGINASYPACITYGIHNQTVGLFLNVARRQLSLSGKSYPIRPTPNISNGSDGSDAPYKTVRGNQPVHVHPSSVLFSISGGEKRLPQCVVFAELLVTSKQYMRCITCVEEAWLYEIAPNFFKTSDVTTKSSSGH